MDFCFSIFCFVFLHALCVCMCVVFVRVWHVCLHVIFSLSFFCLFLLFFNLLLLSLVCWVGMVVQEFGVLTANLSPVWLIISFAYVALLMLHVVLPAKVVMVGPHTRSSTISCRVVLQSILVQLCPPSWSTMLDVLPAQRISLTLLTACSLSEPEFFPSPTVWSLNILRGFHTWNEVTPQWT